MTKTEMAKKIEQFEHELEVTRLEKEILELKLAAKHPISVEPIIAPICIKQHFPAVCTRPHSDGYRPMRPWMPTLPQFVTLPKPQTGDLLPGEGDFTITCFSAS